MFLSRDWVGEDNPRVIARKRGQDYTIWGLIGQALSAIMLFSDPNPSIELVVCAAAMLSLATPVLMVGCFRHARHKHYPHLLGIVCGLLSLPGVMILYCLPDRFAWTRRRKGFDVVMPKRASTLWAATEEDFEKNRPASRPVVNYMQNVNLDED
ncbi:MAG TPA: hypothetical protein VL282_05220 [Tepidisphaeraceae bacterium]|jgi:hypothetical protein|nr:hypothetical protein [Tepidisphaeraceae bacterium]